MRGLLEVRPPATSLTANRRRAPNVDLDDPSNENFKSEKTPHYTPVKEYPLRANAMDRSVAAALALNGPDGVYWIRARVEGTTAKIMNDGSASARFTYWCICKTAQYSTPIFGQKRGRPICLNRLRKKPLVSVPWV